MVCLFSVSGVQVSIGKNQCYIFGIASYFHAFKINEASLQVERKYISFHDKSFSKIDLKFPYQGLKTNALTESVIQWKY